MSTEKIVSETEEKEESTEGVKLQRVFSVWDAIAHITGGIIGSGIFVSPKEVLNKAGSPAAALIVWAVTGVISFLGALCYAELALLLPESGSDYTYIKRGCGKFVAFLYMWVSTILARPAGRAAVALTFSTYFCRLFFYGCPPEEVPDILIRIVAYLALSLLTIINCYRMNWVLVITDALTTTKVIALMIIIITGLACFGIGGDLTKTSFENVSSELMWQGTNTDPAAYVFAFYASFWAYNGYDNVGNIVEEIRQPIRRNIPVSVVGALLIVIAVYVLANFAYLIVLTPSELLSSDAVALTFGAKVSPVFFWMIPLFVAASTLGALNTSIINSSREVLVSTRAGHLPEELSLIHAGWLTPIPSLVFNFLMSGTFLWTNSIKEMMLYATYIGVMSSAMSVATMIFLRTFRRNDETTKDRTLNLPIIIPIIYLLFFVICLIIPIYDNPKSVAICFGFIASGIPVYFMLVFPAQLPEPVRKVQHKVLVTFQKIFMAVPEDEASKAHTA